ncbi:hypothetical protein STEG23_024667 [Scotinomys teguina]
MALLPSLKSTYLDRCFGEKVYVTVENHDASKDLISRSMAASKKVFSFVYDYETCQLLAAPIYFREDMGIEEPTDGVNFHSGKSKPLGNKVPLHRLLTVCYLKWTNRTQNKGLDYQSLPRQGGCSFSNRPFLRLGQNGTIVQVTFAIWKGDQVTNVPISDDDEDHSVEFNWMATGYIAETWNDKRMTALP